MYRRGKPWTLETNDVRRRRRYARRRRWWEEHPMHTRHRPVHVDCMLLSARLCKERGLVLHSLMVCSVWACVAGRRRSCHAMPVSRSGHGEVRTRARNVHFHFFRGEIPHFECACGGHCDDGVLVTVPSLPACADEQMLLSVAGTPTLLKSTFRTTTPCTTDAPSEDVGSAAAAIVAERRRRLERPWYARDGRDGSFF